MARVYLLNEAAGMLRPSPQGCVDGVTRDVSAMAEISNCAYSKQTLGHKQVSSKANLQAYQGPFLSEKSLIDTPTSCEVNSHSCMLDSPVYGVDGRLAFLVVKRHGSPLLALASPLTQKATPQI
jgi:hypothetical protein